MVNGSDEFAKDYHFIFIDIVGFSKPGLTASAQVHNLQFLNEIVRKSKTVAKTDWNSIVKLPTGDGMVLGFPDSAEQPLQLAIEIHKRLNEYNKDKTDANRIDVRIGLHTGAVYKIKDINGMDNVCGSGIIIARRVMDFGDTGHILASNVIAENLIKLKPEYANMIKHEQTYLAKHQEPMDLYNVFDEQEQIGNKERPKGLPSKYPNIEMLQVKRVIEIIDINRMLVRHKQTTVFKNVSEQVIEKFVDSIDTDVPTSWDSLNLRVFSKYENRFAEVEVITDTPLHKTYHVKLSSYVFPGQIGEYTMQYDLEEPERYFLYVVHTQIGLFEFVLIYPKSIGQLSFRVYDFKPDAGAKIPVAIRPEYSEFDEKNVIIWTANNPKIGSNLRFEW